MPLTARMVKGCEVQAVCQVCGYKSKILARPTKFEAYDILRSIGWKLQTRKKKAWCPEHAKKRRSE